MLEYRLSRSNLKRCEGADELPPIRLEPLQATDLTGIGKAKALHDAQPVHCLRSLEEFTLYLQSGHMQSRVALAPDGSPIGYLTANPERNRITELCADSETALAGMVRAWFAQKDARETTVILPSWPQYSAQYLDSIAEDVRLTNSGNWRIFDWRKVIFALLRVKGEQHRLADGALCIAIRKYGNVQISVCGKNITCESTSGRADAEWDSLTAARVLFGNVPPACVSAIPPSVEPLAASWFPLPLSWLPQNYV
jgi:hypothetical protein